MVSNSIEVSKTNHRIFGRGRGFPRMYKGKPCTIDSIRVALAGGTRTIQEVAKILQQLDWAPEPKTELVQYLGNVLSLSTKKGLIRRESLGHYKLRPGDLKPIQWVTKNKPELVNGEMVETQPPVVRRSRASSQITVEDSNGHTQTARRLCGKMDFCWPGTERALFTVKFEVYPSSG